MEHKNECAHRTGGQVEDGEWYANRIITLQERVAWLIFSLEHIKELGKKTRERSAEKEMYDIACIGLLHALETEE